MKKIYLSKNLSSQKIILYFSISFLTIIPGCFQKSIPFGEREDDMYDGAGKAMEFEMERTKDPATGKVPTLKLLDAILQTEQLKNNGRNSPASITALSWQERGPNGDFTVGGNPRPTGQQTSGRVRALMVDSTDATHKTVWAGGVDGGLWKTTDITVSPSPWQLVNDYLSNLAISAICQDPRPGFQNIMYICTGESFRNADAVRGVAYLKVRMGALPGIIFRLPVLIRIVPGYYVITLAMFTWPQGVMEAHPVDFTGQLMAAVPG